MKASRSLVLALLPLMVLLYVVGAGAKKQEAGEARKESPAKGKNSLGSEPQAPSRTLQRPTELTPPLPTPRLLKSAGTLKDELGKPRSGAVSATFAIYKEQEGGAALWVETQKVELDEQGQYTVLLGATTSEGLPLELFTSGQPRWLGVHVNLPREVEQPRVLLVSEPYALKAVDAETLGGKPLSSFVLAAPQSESGPIVTKSVKAGATTAGGAATIGGGGTQNAVAKFDATGANAINSSISDNGSRITAGEGIDFSSDFSFVGNANPAATGRVQMFDRAFVGFVIRGLNVLFETLQGNPAAPVEAMRVTQSGNVGIGTSAPSQKLEVAGLVKVSGAGAGNMPGSVQIKAPGKGIVVQSPDGTKCRQIGIDNNGSRVITAVQCPNRPRCAYVANEVSSSVTAYIVDPLTGTLGAVANSPFTGNGISLPLSVAADPSGQYLYVANSSGGNFGWVSAFGINASTCALTAISGSPFPPFSSSLTVLIPSGVAVHPSGSFLYMTSETGSVSCFTINRSTGALSQCSNPTAPAGTLTNSIALHPSQRFAYATNLVSGDVSGYSIDLVSGNLTPLTGSPFATDCRPVGSCLPSNIALDPLGKFAYVANADATISSYTVDASIGKLTLTPLSPLLEPNPSAGGFSWGAVDTSGNFTLAAATGGFVAVCQINRSTGDCAEITGSPFGAGAGPSSIAVDPAGKFVYATNGTASSISAYTIDPISGVLTPIVCGQCQTGSQPISIVVAAPAP